MVCIHSELWPTSSPWAVGWACLLFMWNYNYLSVYASIKLPSLKFFFELDEVKLILIVTKIFLIVKTPFIWLMF